MIGLQPAERFVDLLGRARLGVAVNLGHQECFLPIPVLQRFPHADFAVAAVVVPAIVEEIDALIEGGANDADAFLLVALHADVVTAKPDAGDFFACVSQSAVGDAVSDVGDAGSRCARRGS